MTGLEIVLLISIVLLLAGLALVLSVSTPPNDTQSEIDLLRTEISKRDEIIGLKAHLLSKYEESLDQMTLNYNKLAEKFDTLQHQKKSSEVKVGQLSEQVIGLLDGFDYDSKQMRFIGSPIDYVVFGEDMITFLEVKTGGSQLSLKQKHIQKLVKSGKVEWKTVRLTEKGLK